MNSKLVEILPFIETLMLVLFAAGFLGNFVLFYWGVKNKDSFALYDPKPFRRKSYKMLVHIYDKITDEEKKRTMLRLMKYHRIHTYIFNSFFAVVLIWILIRIFTA
ncbi:hypothetical protein [Cytophaga aurantiaca]|uniref:hypothetical protein n=1 Tax=Cytophaga aurantiaca TaxID=29530 RepID=UPI00036C464B|nr:hypothetical protein [Cytophaga aurantiaca]